MNEEIKIRLTGEGVRPGLVRSKELAEILESIEDMVVSESLKRTPSLKKDDIVVGLYQIEDNSIGLVFRTTLASVVIPAFIATSQAVEANEYDLLTTQSLKSLEVLSNFSKRHNCNAEFSSSLSNNVIAEITPATKIPKPSILEGSTEIAGKIIRVGGKKPKAMLELFDGTTLYCDIPESLAQELGHRLYKIALFSGYAKWNTRGYEIEEFKIDSFKEFQQVPVNKMFQELAGTIGSYFSNIEDVPAFVSNIRKEGGVA